ncbi:MFS transporter [Pseudomonas sp. PB3P13]
MSESSEGLFKASLPQKLAALSVPCIASLPIMVMPFIFSAVIEQQQLDSSTATYATTAEIGMIAIASLFVSLVLRYLPPRLTVMVGLVVAAIGQIATIYSSDVATLFASRAFVGLGEGLCMGIGFACLAQMIGGSKLLAYASGVVAALSLVSFLVIPALEPHLGYASVFWFMVVVTVLCIPLAIYMPKNKLKHMVSSVSVWQVINVRSVSLFAVALLASSGSNTLWLYFEQVGRTVGMTMVDIGNLGVMSSVPTLLVPFVANFIYARTKSVIPIMAACLISAGAAFYYSSSGSWLVFSAVVMIMSFAYVFLLAYVRMFAAYLDPTGRTTAAVSGADSLGMVIGPLVAAITLNVVDDFTPLSNFGLLAQGLCFVPCLIILLIKSSKRSAVAA